MSKAALNAAGVSLAHDLKGDGMAVAILHPGETAEIGLFEGQQLKIVPFAFISKHENLVPTFLLKKQSTRFVLCCSGIQQRELGI